MIARKAVRSLLLALVLTCGAGLPAWAGSHGGPPHWQAGGALLFGDGLGEFGRAAGEGVGLSGYFVAAPGSGPLGLRVQLAALAYGSETVPAASFPGTSRVHLEVDTDNWYFNLAAGPQIMKRSGRLRPYVNVLGGFSYFSTISGIRGDHGAVPFAQTTNFDDLTVAWSAGGGLMVPLGRSVGLDLGARYLGNSTVDDLAEGDLFEDEDGTLVIEPRTRSRSRRA